MRVTGYFTARVIDGFQFRTARYVPDAIKLLWERYGFVQFPTTAEEMLAQDKPMVFRHGKFKHGEVDTVILALTVYPSMIAVDVATTTDDAEAVVDDLGEWGKRVLDAELLPMKERQYVSQLEVKLELDLGKSFPALDGIGAMISGFLRQYRDADTPAIPFGVSALALTTDPVSVLASSDFRLERRVNISYESQLYFSQAPLKTGDHILVLDKLERALLAGA